MRRKFLTEPRLSLLTRIIFAKEQRFNSCVWADVPEDVSRINAAPRWKTIEALTVAGYITWDYSKVYSKTDFIDVHLTDLGYRTAIRHILSMEIPNRLFGTMRQLLGKTK